MIVGYCFVETRTCPFGFCSAFDSHGCHVTATLTRPAAKAAPASPEVRSTCCTSLSDRWWRLSTYASNHWLVEPALTATFWPLSCSTDVMLLSATIPSPPTEASSPSTSTDWMPFAYVREYVSTVVAIALRLPALNA